MNKKDLVLNYLQWLICIYEIIYLIYMNKKDLDLNYLQWLICYKTKPTNLPTITITIYRRFLFFF